MRQSSSLPVPSSSSSASTSTVGARRRGLIGGTSEQFNRYKILKRQQRRISQNRIAVGLQQPSSNLSSSISSGNYNGELSSNSDHSLDQDPDLEIQKTVAQIGKLANDLYLPLKEKNSVNLVYSPLGFCISALMLKLGSKGITKEELYYALKTSNEASSSSTSCSRGGAGDEAEEEELEIMTGLGALLNELKGSHSTFILKQANKIYLEEQPNPDHTKRVTIKPFYKNRVESIYNGVQLESLPFSNEDWESVSASINKWAHSAGGKMLGDILTRRTINNRMVLINPIYFKGNWLYPFNPELTSNGRFFTDEKNFEDVPMMRTGALRNLLCFSINKLACKVILLPFQGNRLAFVIFLPNDKGGLLTVETGLENIRPSEYFQSGNEFRKKLGSKSGFDVILPRFTIDTTIDFEGPMKEFGIETAFQPDKADFSGMMDDAQKGKYCVTQILQKVMVVIDEYGSSKPPSSASTKPKQGSSFASAAAKTDFKNKNEEIEVTEFRVDHPFYFQVVDMKSDLILFAGSCKNPLHGKELGFKEFLKKYDISVTSESTLFTQAFIKGHGKL